MEESFFAKQSEVLRKCRREPEETKTKRQAPFAASGVTDGSDVMGDSPFWGRQMPKLRNGDFHGKSAFIMKIATIGLDLAKYLIPGSSNLAA
jgi:hypothetical protein